MKNDIAGKPNPATIMQNEYIYSSAEVAKKLDVSVPTVRKHAQILERAGYAFLKNGDARQFREVDIQALSEMKNTEVGLEKTAKRLVFEQKERESNMPSIVSPLNTTALQQGSSGKIELSVEEYDDLKRTFVEMAASSQQAMVQLAQEFKESERQRQLQGETIKQMQGMMMQLMETVESLKQGNAAGIQDVKDFVAASTEGMETRLERSLREREQEKPAGFLQRLLGKK